MSTCTCCHRPLTDLETYGHPHTPLCWSCYSNDLYDDFPQEFDDEVLAWAAATSADERTRVAASRAAADREASGQLQLL